MPPYPVVTTVVSSVYVRMTYVCVCMYVRTYVLYIGVLKMMQARIETLRSTLDRVTARVSEPHAKIVSRTRQLSRLQVRTYVCSLCWLHHILLCTLLHHILLCTLLHHILCTLFLYVCFKCCTFHSFVQSSCDLLRKIIRMLYLLKRLKALMQAGTREITKVAQTFSEIGACV